MEPGKKTISKSIIISTLPDRVWRTLTETMLMKKWVSDNNIQINTTWEPQTPITFIGTWHYGPFNDKGVVLKFEKENVLQYSYFSTIAELPDTSENYLLVTFRLTPLGGETLLELTTENIRDEETYGHWNFYWTVTLGIIKRMAEELSE